ncbi:ArsR/SmtB family transcription factor [Kitasatospora sp. NPDC048365]|uniref:ArsR/SmtB family transcription factor n=1 Tax=Kitasatospora sp. NPDC048365 TaxID=3364050 RepID=UPI00371D6ADF
MLRIHFTATDLARVRVAPTAGPLAETFQSLQILSRCRNSLPFQAWRRSLAGRLTEGSRPLRSLVPAPDSALDLIALAGMDPSVEAGLDTLLGVADHTMRVELEIARLPGADRGWLAALMSGDLPARRVLADSLDATHRALVLPHWSRMRGHLDSYRADCARTVMDGGIERLLESLCPPHTRWSAPVLEIGRGPEVDVRLEGRGLVVAPMVFMTGRPQLLFDVSDEGAAPILTVPTLRDPLAAAALWDADREAGDASLAALLGRTRAAALDIVTESCSTTELARRLNVSAAAASQHATVLRNANLITTRRRGGAVLHTITPLGADLLSRAHAVG